MNYWEINTTFPITDTVIVARIDKPVPSDFTGYTIKSITSTTKVAYVEYVLNKNKDQLYETEWISEFTSALYKYADVKVIGNVNDWRRIRIAIYDLDDAKGEDALDALAKQHNDPNIQTSTITWIAKAIIAWNNDNSYPFQRTNMDFQEYYHIIEATSTGSFKPIFNLINAEITRLEQADSGGDIV